MRHNFKKIISMILTVCMLLGTMAMLIPVSASAAGTTVELKLNADNIINGYNYRFETNDETGKYAKIEDGKLKFFLKKGDIFYISNLTVKDATSSYTIEGMTCPVNDMYIQIANGVSKSSSMYGSGFGGYNWKGYTWKWDGNSVNNSSWTFNSADHDSQAESWGGTKSQGSGKDAIWAANEVLSIKGTFDTWAELVPTTHFYEGTASLDGVGNSDMRLRWYPHAGSCVGKSFGIIVNETNGGEISIDKITATNMNETASYVETFEIQTEEPETPAVINLTPNADNWINGQNYRLETSGTDTYAKIEDGVLKLKMNKGDLFWIPSLTVKDATSTFTFENMIPGRNDPFIQIASHVKTGTNMYGSGFGSYNWKGYRWKWNTEGQILSNVDYIFNDASADGQYGSSASSGSGKDAVWATGEALSVKGTYSGNVPVTYFYEGYTSLDGVANSDMYLRWYDFLGSPVGTSFGIICSGNPVEFTIDKITATNMNEASSYVEAFDRVVVRDVTDSQASLTLNGTIGLNFAFNAENLPDTAKVVVTKNGETIANVSVVEGENVISAPVNAKEMGDEVNFSVMVDGKLFKNLSYTVSVKDYASAILSDNAYAEWHDLIRAMLNYGAAAQKVLGYKTDALVADISALDYDMSSTDAVTVTGDTSKLAGLFATLTLESDTALNLYAKAKDDAAVTATVNGVAAAMTLTDDGFYRFTVADVAAEELSDDFVVVLNGETTVTISVSRWAKTTVNANESDDMTTLAKALAAYSAAADAK